MYGFGAGIFFIGYFLLEVPSNLALHRFGARKWIARIMITWGLISACTMFVSSPLSFYAVRFLLGIAEAGFFPGMILYLSYWFPARERARAVGVFMSAIAISYAIGAPISGGIMSVMGGVAGLEDWQWLFLLEAIPAIVAGIVVFLKLPDGPQDAKWLDADEKEWLQATLDGEDETREEHSIGEVIKDRRVLLFAALYFTMVVNVYGLSFWVGEMVDQINGIGDVTKGFVTAIPYTVGDRRHDRASRATATARASARPSSRSRSRWPPPRSWSAPSSARSRRSRRSPSASSSCSASTASSGRCRPRCSSGAAAAAGIAAINSIGNIGGFVGPYLVGLVKDATGSTDGGLVVLAALLAIGSAIALKVAHEKDLELRRRRRCSRTGRFERTRAGEPCARHMSD